MYKQDLNRGTAAFGGSAWTVPESKARSKGPTDIVPVGRVVARRPGAGAGAAGSSGTIQV